MMIKKDKLIVTGSMFSLILSLSTITHATNSPTIKFFVSNNTQVIDVRKAFERLTGKPQQDLKEGTIDVLQNNHIEQGKFENSLGTYEMSINKKVTGDNTKIFYSSPLQNFSQEHVFSLAGQIAKTFQQESVAVFIPANQSTIGDTVVNFTSHQPSITEAIELVHEKLPAYATAFSLHLNSTHSTFSQVKVTQIEWLGSQIDINAIKIAFPCEKISYNYGQAYLVYQNGQVDQL